MERVTTLSRELFSEKVKCVSIGCLSQSMVDFIVSQKPELNTILCANKDILFWSDRISHTELHRDDFISDIEFENCFADIPKIISAPDYISVHSKDGSISFIKNYSSHVSVAIKFSPNGNMAYRTMYPITDAQLTHYLDKGFAWKYNA
jgi:hypothetical protein